MMSKSDWFGIKPKTYHVSVTYADIENGIVGQSTCCPIALAVCRTLGFNSEEGCIEVDSNISLVGSDYSVYTTTDLFKFIDRFDKRLDVYPFEFDIEIDYRENDCDYDY